MKRTWHKYLIWFSILLLAVALYRADYLKIPSIHSATLLGVSILFLMLGFVANVLSWQKLLAHSQMPLSFAESFATIGLNIFVKYVPGKVGLVLGTAGYVSGIRAYSMASLSMASLAAQLLALWPAFLLGAIGLYLLQGFSVYLAIMVALWFGLSFFLCSKWVRQSSSRIFAFLVRHKVQVPDLRIESYLKLLPWFSLSWLFWVIGFFVLVSSLLDVDLSPVLGFAFPLSAGIGIVAVFAPGGTGVREAVMTGYFALAGIGLSDSVTVAAAARLWFLLGELVMFLLGFFCDRMGKSERFASDKTKGYPNRGNTFTFDNTRSQYEKLAGTIGQNYTAYGVLDYCRAAKQNTLKEPFILCRHDVDANPANALRMAKIDADHGLYSTFYFRTTPRIFHPTIIAAIHEMGHEIGYHYEDYSRSNGDAGKAKETFTKNLQLLRDICDVKTACQHGDTFRRHHNLDFWNHASLADFELEAEPYLSIDYKNMFYFSDVGLRWDNKRFRMRDKVNSLGNGGIKSTPNLIRLLQSGRVTRAAILTHTDNWTNNPALWLTYRMANSAVNTIKWWRNLHINESRNR